MNCRSKRDGEIRGQWRDSGVGATLWVNQWAVAGVRTCASSRGTGSLPGPTRSTDTAGPVCMHMPRASGSIPVSCNSGMVNLTRVHVCLRRLQGPDGVNGGGRLQWHEFLNRVH